MQSSPSHPTAARGRRMSIKIVTPPTEEQEAAERRRIKRILWRDLTFLFLAGIGAHLISYVELHASEAELRGGESSPNGIVDTGFIVTTKIYHFLRDHPHWNDVFAALNSIALILPAAYTAYVTLWAGGYELAFRYLATQLLRSFCGWFTYLPPSPEYLPSNYDFPDIVQCIFVKDCSQALEPEVLPFVSFFSGHVCAMVLTGNHMYTHGHKTFGVFCHVVNVLQIIRLLATRGHYSIDIIIGWYVAKYVSSTAGRLGRHFSRGQTLTEMTMPSTATEAFEAVTGVRNIREELKMSRLMRKKDLQQVLMEIQEDEIEIEFEESATGESIAKLAAEKLAEKAKKT